MSHDKTRMDEGHHMTTLVWMRDVRMDKGHDVTRPEWMKDVT